LFKICKGEYTKNGTSEVNKMYEERLKELNSIAYL